jgi:hypothetical protein
MARAESFPPPPPPRAGAAFSIDDEPRKIELWQLMVAQLDVSHFEYSVAEIAGLFGKCAHAITPYCRALFPRESGARRAVHRLDFEQAVLLIRKVCRDGKRLPDVRSLYQRLRAEGIITRNFPADHPSCRAAEIFLARRRAEVLNR